MEWLAKLLGKRDGDANLLVVIPIPPLITLLQQQEALKGAALTETEVVGIRDRAICMTMSRSRAEQLAARRGFHDIDPSRAWEEYVRVRPHGAE